MPKANFKKRNGTATDRVPYAQAAAKTKAANSIFRMNTDIGQHVLKNPGVAQAIVDKADLKQSDVRCDGHSTTSSIH
jgi:18S rRNA (adenine1779-N6/adenine1780-N6)-dimethyltransferase